MTMSGIMGTSAAGMAAQSDRLNATADNIANVSTTGYKKASAEFSTLVLQGAGMDFQSGSVETRTRRAVSGQGAFGYTQSPTDLAINGNGFFVVSGPNGSIALTRAGSFIADRNGDLVNTAGFKLLGYDMSNGPSGAVVNGVAGLSSVNLQGLALRAAASTAGTLEANIPSNAPVVAPADLPSANGPTPSFAAKTSIVAYDNLGGAVTLDMYLAKTGAGLWEISAFDRSTAVGQGAFPYSAPPLATQILSFDLTTGALDAASASAISVPIPNGQTLNFDLTAVRQLAADFAVTSAEVNGNAPVAVNRVEISDAGILTAVYENGARIPSFRVPLGRVPSPDNMISLSGNVFQPSVNSGDMLIGDASVGGAGTIISGALEVSTVDLADELTTMIESQRSYTANSRVFQTGSELMDVIVNLRR